MIVDTTVIQFLEVSSFVNVFYSYLYPYLLFILCFCLKNYYKYILQISIFPSIETILHNFDSSTKESLLEEKYAINERISKLIKIYSLRERINLFPFK